MIVLCADAALVDSIARGIPPGWEVTHVTGLAELGGFQDVLLHRFALLDLDEHAAFDPVETIEEIRGAMMLNIPIFCFGGDPATRDAARRARADRFFERSEVATRVPRLCEQFNW
jgi:hypothetical protein